MNPPYRIAMADDDEYHRVLLRQSIEHAGHEVIVEATSGEELVRHCTASSGSLVQLVVTDVVMGGMTGIEAAAQILGCREIPFIIVSAHDDNELIQRASDAHALGFLVKPVRVSELKAAIAIAAERFQELRESRSEARELRQALEDRKLVEHAKAILMRERFLDESEAFSFLQKLARQHRQKLADIAKSVILGATALNAASHRT